MTQTPSSPPTSSWRLFSLWAIAFILFSVIVAFLIFWIKLPTWKPEIVAEYSPWFDPVFRAVSYDTNQEVVRLAKNRLEAMGKSIVPDLLERLEYRLEQPDFSDARQEEIRYHEIELICEVLGRIKDNRSVAPLMRIYRQRCHEVFGVGPWLELCLLNHDTSIVANEMLPLPTISSEKSYYFIKLAGDINDKRLVYALKDIILSNEIDKIDQIDPSASKSYHNIRIVSITALLNSSCPDVTPDFLSDLFKAMLSHNFPHVRAMAHSELAKGINNDRPELINLVSPLLRDAINSLNENKK